MTKKISPGKCTYWQKVNTWYGRRSGYAHENSYETDPDEAQDFGYWAFHQYVAPVLDWLLDHTEDPAGDLAAGLAGLDSSDTDWQTIINEGDKGKLISSRKA